MERLTRPDVTVDDSAAQYMGLGKVVNLQTMNTKVLEIILNGPTINGVNKDVLRQIIRQLYARLQAYESGMPDQLLKETDQTAENWYAAYKKVSDLLGALEVDVKSCADCCVICANINTRPDCDGECDKCEDPCNCKDCDEAACNFMWRGRKGNEV